MFFNYIKKVLNEIYPSCILNGKTISNFEWCHRINLAQSYYNHIKSWKFLKENQLVIFDL